MPDGKQYPTDPAGELDAGVARDLPCTKRTWCTRHEGHPVECHERPRVPIEPSDYGPRRTKE